MAKTNDYQFVPYEFPTSRDGKYICLLDDGQILRSRREQLGLSVKQVAEMAGLQFSQYQRLESGDRFFSGCSMRVGLSICAVLLLDPYDFFCIDVEQPDPATMKPHEPFDADIPEIPKKVGRKPIRRDVMTIYVNHPHFSLMLPRDVLIALGKPEYIQMRWNVSEKRLLFHAVNADAEEPYDVPAPLYDDATALVFPKSEFIDNVRKELGWDDDVYAVECRMVEDVTGEQYILCDLKTAQPSDRLIGPFVEPSCFIDDEDEEFEDEEDEFDADDIEDMNEEEN